MLIRGLDNEWDGYERKILPASYDCIIFVAESSAARPLDPSRSRYGKADAIVK
jgi:hypothetical protein